MELNAPEIKRIIKDCSLYLCQECGKCSASCPRFLSGREYSPRLLAQKLISQPGDRAYIETAIWECLSCGRCEERCPSNVQFTRFIREMRAILAADQGLMGHQAHDGALHSWMRIMTAPELRQDRLDWLTPDLKTDATSEVAFFSGCAPYFDVFFAGLRVDTLRTARDSIRLLNFLEITPQVLANERCCGHDLLWSGDVENFAALARLNHQEFRDRGVKEIVTACPECFQALGAHLSDTAHDQGFGSARVMAAGLDGVDQSADQLVRLQRRQPAVGASLGAGRADGVVDVGVHESGDLQLIAARPCAVEPRRHPHRQDDPRGRQEVQ